MFQAFMQKFQRKKANSTLLKMTFTRLTSKIAKLRKAMVDLMVLLKINKILLTVSEPYIAEILSSYR